MKTIKTILLWLMTAVIGTILGIILVVGKTAWLWLPILLPVSSFCQYIVGFILGIFISSMVSVFYNAITNI